METSSFAFEQELQQQGYGQVIGVDEAGRGPLAGPVVAAATMARNFQSPNSKSRINSESEIQNSKQLNLIRDSKLLSEKQREGLYDFILENFWVGVGLCDHETIDRINILEATYLAMKKALTDLFGRINNQDTRNKIQTISNFQFPISNKIPNLKIKNKNPDIKYIILVDGNKTIPNFSYEQKAIINGDKLVKSISAASIVAKVTRDRLMRSFHEKYPQYGFDRHKGYGTKAHVDALKKYGPCEIHRKSFAPVRSLI